MAMRRVLDVETAYNEKTPMLGQDKQQKCSSGIPKRWMLTILGFFGFFNVYAMRVNLSVTMVAMTKKLNHPSTHGDNSSSIACVELLQYSPYDNISFGQMLGQNHSGLAQKYDWDAETQSLILGSFFYGYVITQIPGGILAEKYGAKWLYGIGIFITAVFTLLTPYAALLGAWPLIVVRIIEGLGEGVTYPAMNVLIGRWAPKMERSRMTSIIFNGSAVGNVFSFALSGIISATIGWPWVFFIFGALGVIWTVFWLCMVYETPDTHPWITEEELLYIKRSQEERDSKAAPIPWKAILTSSYIWALVVTHFGQNWAFYTILTELPTYLNNILHFELKKNGTLSALPYLAQACVAIFGSFVADKMRASKKFRINIIRKTFNSLAFFLPALFIGFIGYAGCQPFIVTTLLILSMGFNGLIHSGFNVTHVDMSPEFSGTLMGITNCIANFSGFLAPAYVGFITKNGQSVENWQTVFLTTTGVLVVTGFVYNIFCSAELQPWGISKPIRKRSLVENEDNVGICKVDHRS